MIVDGRQVALSTGTDVEAIKKQLYNGFFRLPNQPKPLTKKPRRK